jgi:hypothetical protein
MNYSALVNRSRDCSLPNSKNGQLTAPYLRIDTEQEAVVPADMAEGWRGLLKLSRAKVAFHQVKNP